MGKFIEVRGVFHYICIDKEEIKGFARSDRISEECPHGVIIYLKNKEKPEEYIFSNEQDAIDFFEDIRYTVTDSSFSGFHACQDAFVRDSLLVIEKNIEKINKKLFSLKKEEKNV